MTDTLDMHSQRHVGYLLVLDQQGFLPGDPCASCGKAAHHLYLGTLVKRVSSGWVCAWCAAPPENIAGVQEPGPDGTVAIRMDLNGAVKSNPFLNPLGNPYATHSKDDRDFDQAWLDFGFTDLGNSERLVLMHGDHFRYVPGWGHFVIYDGFRWVRDEHAALERYAKNVVCALADSAKHLTGFGDEQQSLLKHATASCSKGRIDAMIHLARSHARVVLSPDHFDRATHLLNTRNGVVDLQDGAIMDPDPGDLITHLAQVDYDPDAECPLWDDFLEQLAHGDHELIEWLQKAVGYSLTGESTEQVFFFLFGDGANGKSTFLEVIRDLLGDYATTVGFDVFLKGSRTNIEHGLAAMRGVRFATASEAPEGRSWNEELLKTVTGGERVRASMKYVNAFEFTPVCKIWFSANDQPTVTGVNEGIWRRFVPIPCMSHIPEGERDGNLPKKLKEERNGILAWAARGAQLWHQDGLRPFPKVVQDALAQYRSDSDVFTRYVQEQCTISKEILVETPASSILQDFNEWAKANAEKPLNHTSLAKRLAKFRGGVLTKEKGSDGRVYYSGIQLSAQERDGENW